MEIVAPRDRDATFEHQIIKKGQRRFEGFDDKIISMYARGISVNKIRGHLEEIYGIRGCESGLTCSKFTQTPSLIF